MKSVFCCVVASNGSSFISISPCLKSFFIHRIFVSDFVNHQLWSGFVGEPKSEVSKFINKFNN